jgi:DNA-binding NarL/FixJ family response regulator
MSPIDLLIAEDHPAVRVGICRFLADQPDMRVVAESAGALEAVSPGRPRADVAIVDYHLADRNGLWVTDRLRQLDPPPSVLIYSAFADHALAVAAIVAGADGVLGKSATGDELCTAIRRLASGHRYLPSISSSVARAMSARLDPRGQVIFGMLIHGIAVPQIAVQLGISAGEFALERSAMLGVLAPSVTRARQSHLALGYPRA